MNYLTVFLALSSLSAALPSAIAASKALSHPFIVKSRTPSHHLTNTTFSNLLLTPYHIAPAYNYATLFDPSTTNTGIIGQINGKADELANRQGYLIFDFGSGDGDLPYGFVIDQFNATYNPVLINAGNGTRGIFVDRGVIKYNDPQSGGFYACSRTLLYGPAIQLFYRPKTTTIPNDCAEVELIAEDIR